MRLLYKRLRVFGSKMLKKRLTSLKKIEKVVFFIRRMQKVGQKGRGTDFWPGPPVRGPMEGILTVGKKMGRRRLNARGAFALTIQTFARFRIKNVKKAFDFPKKN